MNPPQKYFEISGLRERQRKYRFCNPADYLNFARAGPFAVAMLFPTVPKDHLARKTGEPTTHETGLI
jgi:hypothetical protein